MKKSLDISLNTIHIGSVKRVVTLGMNQHDQAYDYLLKLGKSNAQGLSSILGRLRAIAEHDRFENKQTFRHVGGQVYEVKTTQGLRLYTFLDHLDTPPQNQKLIIAVCGGKKGNKKEQSADIAKAKQMRADYLAAKKSKTTTIKIIDKP